MGARSGETGTPFLGRAEELEALRADLGAASSGDGRLVLLSGEAGIGKTRLADALAVEARRSDARVLWGRCWEAGGAPAYWPWVQAIQACLRDMSPSALARDLGSGGPHLARIIPELREILPDLPESTLDESDGARFQVFEAMSRFLRAIAAHRPVVIILDDLHAADEPSLLLLNFLAADLSGSRLLVLAVYRDSELEATDPRFALLADLARLPIARRLTPRALSETEVSQYIELAASTVPAPGVAEAVHRETEGNPLFVGEVVRLLADEGRLNEVGGPSSRPFGVTEGVRAVIGHRLARLTEPCRELLARASVLGVDVRTDVLARIDDRPADELVELLDEAVSARVLQEPASPGGRWRFGHAMIRDVLYSALPASARMRLHRRIGETLEALHGSDRDPPLAEIAHHFLAADARLQAVQYARRAAELATGQFAHEEAARLYRRTLQLPGLDESTRCALLLGFGEAATRAGDLADGREAFLQAAVLAERLGLAEDLARAAVGYGGRFIWLRAGDDQLLVPLLERALDVLGPAESHLRVRLLARLAGALRDEPTVARRAALSSEALDMARRLDDPVTTGYALLARVTAIMGPDALTEMTSLADELRRVAAATGDRELIADSHWMTGVLLATIGGDAAAMRAEVAFMGELARELRQPSHFWYHGVMQTILALLEGRLADVEGLLPETRQRAEPFSYQSSLFLLRREQGRLDEVADQVRRAIDEFPGYRLFTCVSTYTEASCGREAAARSALDGFARDGYAFLPRDGGWLFGLMFLAETALRLGSRERAAEIEALLAPYAGLFGTASGEGSAGPVDRILGLLAAAAGRLDEGLRMLEKGADQSDRMGARLWQTRIAVERADCLVRRGNPGDRELAIELLRPALATCEVLGLTEIEQHGMRLLATLEPDLATGASVPGIAEAGARSFPASASLRREGEYWTIEFDRTFRLHDAKGLRYLALLVSNPGREFHALDLVTLAAPAPQAPRSIGEVAESGLRHSDAIDTTGVIDHEAKLAYRARLRDLQEDLDEARTLNDPERADRARAEMDALEAELAAAFGLGGRSRPRGSRAERARQSVTKAIRDAQRRLSAEDEGLGLHLARSVRTGVYCAYDPDPNATPLWRT